MSWFRSLVVNGLFLDGVLHSEAAALEGDGFGVVQESVEDGGGQGGVAIEDLRPVLEDAVGGDRDGATLVAMADDLEQQVGAGLVDGQISEFVEDQESWPEEACEVAFELSGGLGGGEGVDGVDGAGEQHGVTVLAGVQPQGGDQMRLAQRTWRT